ncbi:16s rrna methyltransferase [Nannochloropsis gaditana]|uniref:16s rrna methyltransferase n=1 Tax=Nannochloropsis gaditana TaxID=72520 RepID=W7TRV0_9STRA|nr:16s rrna methyltransferase [Nannochloropsis gaditana]
MVCIRASTVPIKAARHFVLLATTATLSLAACVLNHRPYRSYPAFVSRSAPPRGLLGSIKHEQNIPDPFTTRCQHFVQFPGHIEGKDSHKDVHIRHKFACRSHAGSGANQENVNTGGTDLGGLPQAPIVVDAKTKEAWPDLRPAQWKQIEALANLLVEINTKINVISRKDIQNVLPNHILPALGLATLLRKAPAGTSVLDIGTGGGFPGLPLAIACPQLNLLLVDATGKKIRAVAAMSARLNLKNVATLHARIEEVQGQRFDYVVGRSVTAIPRFLRWAQPKLKVPRQGGRGREKTGESEEKGPLEDEFGVPVPGVLYVTGLEPTPSTKMARGGGEGGREGGEGEEDGEEEEEEELAECVPDHVYPVQALLGPVYEGDKHVFHFSAAALVKGRVFVPEWEGGRGGRREGNG